MKNNRALPLLEPEFLATHKLSTDEPPKGSLFWKMWDASTEIANQALNTDFIQGIKAGTLDPTEYGGFNVSDAYYCFSGAQDYLAAQARATHPTVQAFLLKKYEGYQKYNATFPQVWHVRDGESIVPSSVTKEYSEFETNVARHQDPIYTVVAMLPCEYLWAWLGSTLSPPSPGNLYASWITGNDYPDGAYAMGNFLVEYMASNSIDENLAISLYQQAMTFEYQNFKIATQKS